MKFMPRHTSPEDTSTHSNFMLLLSFSPKMAYSSMLFIIQWTYSMPNMSVEQWLSWANKAKFGDVFFGTGMDGGNSA